MTKQKLFAGASGYSFKEWKGGFYPQKLKQEDMLAYYAGRLPTVEINSSYYAMPRREFLEKWVLATPEGFRFSIKSPKAITHESRLKADTSADTVTHLYTVLAALGDKRGPVLFQLPPSLKMDLSRLKDFLQLLPDNHQAAFEFRNDSWFCDEVYTALRDAGASLCLSERENKAPPPLVETAAWGYVRLRLETYSDDDLKQWAERLAATSWQEAYVYFMHEPTAPAYAQALTGYAAA